jgi:hypothetical protein
MKIIAFIDVAAPAPMEEVRSVLADELIELRPLTNWSLLFRATAVAEPT